MMHDPFRDPGRAWQPFEPGRDGPWDAPRVAHLHRRAGFGATSGQVRRDVAEGCEASLRRVLDGDERGPDGRKAAEFDELVEAMVQSARRRPSIERVQMLWLFRMVYSPSPLAEVMTLAWHGHYASGFDKVREPALMLDQNLSFRSLWRGPVSKLHLAMLRDPAMLRWLDGFGSTRIHPNENLGREFLELFALGEGGYTERDVREVARALTGWVDQPGDGHTFSLDPADHDAGEKTILGETGPWGAEDVVRIVCRQSAAARQIARRLYRTFVSDVEPPPDDLIATLADAMRVPGDVDVARGVETILRSRLFHSEGCRGKRVKGPVIFAVGAIRSCELFSPPPDFVDLEIFLTRMGQRLFYPPSVAGWPGGLSWLREPTLLARANFATWLTDPSSSFGPDHVRKTAALDGPASREAWLDALATLLIPALWSPSRKAELSDAGRGDASDHLVVRRLLSLPESQVG